MLRRLTLVLVAALAAAVFAAARPDRALADGGGGDNAAVAINTKDGSSIFRLAFSIRRVAGDVVDNTNAAVAFSSCNECQTIAIAIQVVLITSDASTITPTNVAIAINYECTLCETLASAYQFVLSTGGPVHFTAEGNREIARIRHELRELGKSGLSIVEVQNRVKELMQQLAAVIANELVPAGRSGEPKHEQPAETTTASTTTTTEPTETEPTTTTTEPTETTTTTTTTPTTTTTTP